MARMTFKAGDDYALRLVALGGRSEETVKKAIYAGAKIVADQIRKNLEDNLRDPASAGRGSGPIFKNLYSETTGDLADSLGITPITLGKDGYWSAKVGFDGYDRKGVPNQLKARVMESGSSKIRKRPFVRPAVTATKKKAAAEMERVIDEEMQKILKG